MTTHLRKLLLTAHITVSVGWLGAVAAFLALAITGLASRDVQMVRTAYAAMELTARFVIVPLAVASLVSGLLESLCTPWGLFRHYWVLVKLLLTLFATVVLVAKMPLIGYAAHQAAEFKSPNADLHRVGIQLAVHSIGGLLVLLVITALSVYKPWGLTSYGQTKLGARRNRLRPSEQTNALIPGSGSSNETNRAVHAWGLRTSLTVGVAAILMMVHLSLFLIGHGFHHGR